MLLRFSVRNFLSIGEKEELILTSTHLSDKEEGLIEVPNQHFKVLPCAVIYGANASGKSNFLHAFKFLRAGILDSHRRIEAGINRRQFLLGAVPDAETSSFEVDFILPELPRGKDIVKNVRMTYGFEISDKEVVEEWLYAYPKQHRQVWFHRNIREKEAYYFGGELKGNNKIISANTKPVSLFLSTAFANNHTQLTPVFEYFKAILFRLDGLGSKNDKAVTAFIENSELRNKILSFLKNADVGICTASVKTTKQPEEVSTMVSELKSVLHKHFPKAVEKGITVKMRKNKKKSF